MREKTKKVLWVVLGIVGIAVVAVALAWIPFLVPKHQTQLETSSKLVAGLAIAVGLFVAWRRSVAAEKVAEASLKNAETALRTAQISAQTQDSERFIEATRMLGDDNMRVRIGGIYTLESLARYSEDEKQQVAVFEVLCAFIREVRPLRGSDDDAEEGREMAQDVKVAIEAIRRREGVPGMHIDLSCADLEGANLQGANLQGANLWRANLWRAKLQRAKLQEADLQRAKLQEADLEEAKLQEAKLWRAKLKGAYLKGADLQGADLYGTDLEEAKLEEAKLEEANLQEAKLQGAYLKGTDLKGANLYGTDLQGANLRGADLWGAYLQEASGLTQPQLDEATGNHLTILPEGLEYPAHWPEFA